MNETPLQHALRTGKYRLTILALSLRCSALAYEARGNEALGRIIVDHIFGGTVRP